MGVSASPNPVGGHELQREEGCHSVKDWGGSPGHLC